MPILNAYNSLIHFKLFPLFLPVYVLSISFNITHFTSETKDLIYGGLVSPSNGSLDLVFSASDFQVGRVSYAQPLQLWDSSTRRITDFITYFSFTIDVTSPGTILSDGIVFFLAPIDYPIPLNSAGGYLGMFNSTMNHTQVLVVEFDTFKNWEWDPDMQHVGINNGSLNSCVFGSWNANSNIGKTCYVCISYNATTKNLSVFWTYEEDRLFAGDSILSYNIDLMNILPEKVVIGISASTGQGYQRYSVNSWRFDSNLDFNETRRSRRTITIVLGTLGGLFLLLLMMFAFAYLTTVRTKGRKDCPAITKMVDNLVNNELPRRFSYKTLEKATKSFANNMKLGQGGSGQVYKATLQNNNIVAVKRIFTESSSSENIFINEVKIISQLIHRNLVPFVGWCHEKGKFLLVYEYMSNGSLDTHLFDNYRNNILSWKVRYKIVLGLASAIHYLHEEAGKCIIHRDIKPANVLLDKDFNAKLGDFGVAKLVDPHLRTLMTRAVGTLGYMAPEYAYEGRASKQSDMYSFGIVALEMACGRRTYRHGDFHMALVKWVWQLYLAGNILNAVDERLELEFDREEMECLLMVGLWCTHPNEKKRPMAGLVIKVLQLEIPLPKLPDDVHNSTFDEGTSGQSQNDSKISFLSSSLDYSGR